MDARTEQQWEAMLAKSWSPLECHRGREDFGEPTEGSLVWVYKQTEPGTWTVGFFTPSGDWEPEGDYKSKDEAAERVRWLNGGGVRTAACYG